MVFGEYGGSMGLVGRRASGVVGDIGGADPVSGRCDRGGWVTWWNSRAWLALVLLLHG